MSFSRPAGAFDEALKAIVTDSAIHVGDVLLKGQLAKNEDMGRQVISAIKHVAQTGKMTVRFDLGLRPQYHKDSGEFHLNFIDPNSPGVSKSMAVVSFRGGNDFDDSRIKALMDSFIRPEEKKLEPTKKSRHKTPTA